MAATKKKKRRRKKRKTPASWAYTAGILVLLALVVYVAVTLYGIFAPHPSREVESTVMVLNGCGVGGLGLRTTQMLRDRGLDVVGFENADSFEYEESIVVDRTGDMGAAAEVARMLRIANVIQQIPETPLEDIIIVVGADYESYLDG